MTTETSNAESRTGTDSLPANTIFELLLDDQRRDALYYLSGKVGAVALEDLVAQVALRDGEASGTRVDAITAGFRHNHLPKLIDAAVVRYDTDAGTVERRPEAAALDPFLQLARRYEP
ncbi:hypothetical protein C477_07328 [Haloterrigena salina JCM 13891]|uniref:DUF7344 domain-containing protein n=1 Tax=Haloterrigena salina JCM 13891 TaxID=1227488 RepID=M0C922_9EURY|nr:hypothetical protein [Haloterrigena salina]ELZ19771.1 hypothetical protein C477_07328 [Haloterrigena salina JCM 13891]